MTTSVSPTVITPGTILFIIPINNIVYLTINATAPGSARMYINVEGKLGSKRIGDYTFNNKLHKVIKIDYMKLKGIVYP